MPRGAVKLRAKNGNILKPCHASKNTTNSLYLTERELVVNSPKQNVIEEVFHRKSARRRVARDIFLVFEESKSRKNSKASKKIKSKFSHLKVEPIRSKGLLRDIKNEPKSFLNDSNVNLPPDVSILKSCSDVFSDRNKGEDVISDKLKTSIRETVKLGYSKKTSNIKSIKISTIESQPCKLTNEPKIIARVNPIFLWVKQDDTRIVEVRCEDYDKRNRIRITKTSNGWRATPRSDPTTSRVLKFYPTSLMKVKRENNIHEPNNIINGKGDCKNKVGSKNFPTKNILPEGIVKKNDTNFNGNDTLSNQFTINVKSKTKNKKSKKLKKKLHSDKALKKYKTSDTAKQNTGVDIETLTKLSSCFNEHSSDVMDFSVQINSGLESKINELIPGSCLYTDENVPVNTVKKKIEDLENNSNSVNAPFNIDISPKKNSTYQKEREKEFSYLCSKTGLFLPNQISSSEYENESNEILKDQNKSKTTKNSIFNLNKELFVIDMGKIDEESKIKMREENAESLEAKTKNLKDLLDDADLLQNCDGNINIDAELIDTIVKNSCENNLIQVSDLVTKTNMEQMNQKTLHGSNEIVLQILSEVSEPPKCLSFNEAGEIEGLNGELFQSNTFIETFDKQSSESLAEPPVNLHSTTNVTDTLINPQKTVSCENIEHIVEIFDSKSKLHSLNKDSPKDLSYKKREEVCPPSESRSQCAVTSSSDVVKSPQHEETSSLASSSETLKTLILEQFMKLNALTTQHQRETIDVGKHRNSDTSNIKALHTSKSAHSSNVIETVIIEDDDNEIEEPARKRIRIIKQKQVNEKVGKLAMIDKDPDPLTQLRLLIGNSQWKVPDPILVPKERLSAVLASPAREIPLLITTRPELRLPEAFAYPEIIQNPNILVISMAQLEAILKNELKVERTTTFQAINPDVNQQLSASPDVQFENFASELQSESARHQQSSKQSSNILSQVQNDINLNDTDASAFSKTGQEYDKTQQVDLSLPSDPNSATIAMLKRLFWLPYFGHIPQDIVNCAKIPEGLNSQINGITDMKGVVKNTYVNNQIFGHSFTNIGFESLQQQFKTNEELSLFKKIVQHQMQSVLQLNQLKIDSQKFTAPESFEKSVSLIDRTKSGIEPLSQIKVIPNNKQANTSMLKNRTTISSNNISVPEKSYNLRSSVAGRHSLESKQYSNNQRQFAQNKPRLTCKSLSNLLNPEHTTVPSSSSSISYTQNEFLKSFNENKRSSIESEMSESNAEGKRQFLMNTTMVSPCGNIVSIESSNGLTNQKPKPFETSSANNDALGLTADTNIPLWHPLFGSNTKTAYRSPWQWTTVTATGE